MKDIKISKIVVNCCVGESGDRLTRAAKVLEELAGGQAPVFSEGTSCSLHRTYYVLAFHHTAFASVICFALLRIWRHSHLGSHLHLKADPHDAHFFFLAPSMFPLSYSPHSHSLPSGILSQRA